jgi:hypothetical protein
MHASTGIRGASFRKTRTITRAVADNIHRPGALRLSQICRATARTQGVFRKNSPPNRG